MKITLIGWLGSIILFSFPALMSAQSVAPNDVKIAGIKRKIARIEKKDKGRVKVELADGTKLKGTVRMIGDKDFTLERKDTNALVAVAYSEIASMSSWVRAGDKIWVALGVAVLVFAAVTPR